MSQYLIPQFQPYLDEKEYEAIKSCFELNWITEGPKSTEFVNKLLKMMGVKYGVLAPNGDIHFISLEASVGQKISATGVVSTYSLIVTGNSYYTGGVLIPNGDIYFIPYSNAPVGQKISTCPAIPFGVDTCISSYLNKF